MACRESEIVEDNDLLKSCCSISGCLNPGSVAQLGRSCCENGLGARVRSFKTR